MLHITAQNAPLNSLLGHLACCKNLPVSVSVTSPQPLTTERIISHHNHVESPQEMFLTEESMKSRLFLSLNGVVTANYNPSPAIANFLWKREGRNRERDIAIQKKIYYV
jgi:hypothetical protein